MIHSRKATKIARKTNHQKAMRSPFLVGKGAGGIGLAVGWWVVIRVICVIRLIRDSDTAGR